MASTHRRDRRVWTSSRARNHVARHQMGPKTWSWAMGWPLIINGEWPWPTVYALAQHCTGPGLYSAGPVQCWPRPCTVLAGWAPGLLGLYSAGPGPGPAMAQALYQPASQPAQGPSQPRAPASPGPQPGQDRLRAGPICTVRTFGWARPGPDWLRPGWTSPGPALDQSWPVLARTGSGLAQYAPYVRLAGPGLAQTGPDRLRAGQDPKIAHF